MDAERRKNHANVYGAVVTSYIGGLLRMHSSRIGHLSLSAVLLEFRAIDRTGPLTGEHVSVLQELRKIAFHEYDAFEYVGNFGHLVYATTLLDTFLTDTTRFIFLAIPASVGKAQGITVSDIMAARSTSELLRKAVDKRARELSYKSFIDRIEFFKDQYSARIELDDDTRQSLEHFSGIRNVIIHDQGYIDFSPEPDGTIKLTQKSCPVHPAYVRREDIRGAVMAYSRVVRNVANAVFRDILKVDVPSHLNDVINELAEPRAGTLSGQAVTVEETKPPQAADHVHGEKEGTTQ